MRNSPSPRRLPVAALLLALLPAIGVGDDATRAAVEAVRGLPLTVSAEETRRKSDSDNRLSSRGKMRHEPCGDDRFIRVQFQQLGDPESDSGPTNPVTETEIFVDDSGNYLQARPNPEVDDERFGPVSLILHDRSIVDEPNTRDESRIYEPTLSGLTAGYLGGTDLRPLLARARPSEPLETEHGVLTYTPSPGGDFPAKVRLMKRGGDRHQGTTVKMHGVEEYDKYAEFFNDPTRDPGGSNRALGYVRSILYDAEVEEFAVSESGVRYPARMVLTKTLTYETGKWSSVRSEVTAAETPPDRRSGCQFEIEIPVGTNITVENGLQLSYVWDGTAAVPGVEGLKSDVTIAGRAESSSPGWLICLVLVLLAMTGGALYLRTRPR